MRSRYSAYVTKSYAYLKNSLSAKEQADFSIEQTQQWAEQSEWLGLAIMKTDKGGPEDAEGTVEFSARFRAAGEEHEHVETARFAREDGRWVYAGSTQPRGQTVRRETPKIGRNDPCPCGSGKKYKKCCGVGGLSAA